MTDMADGVNPDDVKAALLGMADRVGGIATALGASGTDMALLSQTIGETVKGSRHRSGGAAADNCEFTQRGHARAQGLLNEAAGALRSLASTV